MSGASLLGLVEGSKEEAGNNINSLISQFLGPTTDKEQKSGNANPTTVKVATQRAARATPNTNAYVTMITSDSFGQGADVMLYSLLQTSPAADVVVLVTPQVSKHERAKLSKRGARVVEVEPIANPNTSVHVEGWVNSGYTKLQIWNLVEYKQVVYLDADVLVMENCDELFDLNVDFAAAPDVYPPDKFNAGVLLIRPNKSIFKDMMQKIAALPSHDGGDTGFLNSYYPEWYAGDSQTHLAFGYNAQRIVHWMTFDKQPGYWNSIKPLKVIHYCSNPKPWEDTKKKGPLEMLWFDQMMKSTGVGSLFAGIGGMGF